MVVLCLAKGLTGSDQLSQVALICVMPAAVEPGCACVCALVCLCANMYARICSCACVCEAGMNGIFFAAQSIFKGNMGIATRLYKSLHKRREYPQLEDGLVLNSALTNVNKSEKLLNNHL